MKKLLIVGCVVAAMAGLCLAALPTYKTVGPAAGTSSAGAVVNFPADPNSQIRLISIQWASDTNTGALLFCPGSGAWLCSATNASTSSTTQAVSTTAGIITNATCLLQHAGTIYTATAVGTNSGTNLVLASGGWGVASSIGDDVYQVTTTNSISVGATTNWQNGDALFVGNYGRPVQIVLTPALTTNRINAATAHYDSQSQ